MGYIERIHKAGDPRGECPERLYISDEEMEQFESGEVTYSQLQDRYSEPPTEEDCWDGDASWNE
jgi:hypothetical protein